MSDYATIPVHKETRELLKSYGSKDETYDELIRRILSVLDHSLLMETHYKRLGDKSQFVGLEDL